MNNSCFFAYLWFSDSHRIIVVNKICTLQKKYKYYFGNVNSIYLSNINFQKVPSHQCRDIGHFLKKKTFWYAYMNAKLDFELLLILIHSNEYLTNSNDNHTLYQHYYVFSDNVLFFFRFRPISCLLGRFWIMNLMNFNKIRIFNYAIHQHWESIF